MFSQTAEYALRVVVFLGSLRGAPGTASQIAAATRVPQCYLSKILQSLSRAGFVASQRGLGGGSVLARDPAKISVYDIISVISPLPRIHTCPLGLVSHRDKLCPLHHRLDSAVQMVEQAFRKSTIADLLAEDTTSIPLVDFAQDPAAATRAAEAAFPVDVRNSSRPRRLPRVR